MEKQFGWFLLIDNIGGCVPTYDAHLSGLVFGERLCNNTKIHLLQMVNISNTNINKAKRFIANCFDNAKQTKHECKMPIEQVLNLKLDPDYDYYYNHEEPYFAGVLAFNIYDHTFGLFINQDNLGKIRIKG